MNGNPLPTRRNGAVESTVLGALALWLVGVLVLGSLGAFVSPRGTPPFPILFAVTVPLTVFLAAHFGSAEFQAYFLSIDSRLAAAIQAWRAGGLTFLALYAHSILPGSFAWPAGLGDIAIGVTAPWIVLTLIRQPDFVSNRVFVVWNLLGILDLVIAVTSGALNSILASGRAGEVSTAPMAIMPLVLIPAYLVPLFIMLHLIALFQARLHASSNRSRSVA